jgi:hypothetical protein
MQLVGLFSVGLLVIVVVIIRLIENIRSNSLQGVRTLWAAVETLASVIVANTPAIYSAYRNKKSRSQSGSYNLNKYSSNFGTTKSKTRAVVSKSQVPDPIETDSNRGILVVNEFEVNSNAEREGERERNNSQ